MVIQCIFLQICNFLRILSKKTEKLQYVNIIRKIYYHSGICCHHRRLKITYYYKNTLPRKNQISVNNVSEIYVGYKKNYVSLSHN